MTFQSQVQHATHWAIHAPGWASFEIQGLYLVLNKNWICLMLVHTSVAECAWNGWYICHADVPWITCIPGKSYCRWLRSLLLRLCVSFTVLINCLVCWFCAGALGLVPFQIVSIFIIRQKAQQRQKPCTKQSYHDNSNTYKIFQNNSTRQKKRYAYGILYSTLQICTNWLAVIG